VALRLRVVALVVRRVVRLRVVSVVRLRVARLQVVSVVRLRVVRLRVVVSAVLRRTNLVVVVLVNNNNRWEWEELQCKVVREWVRVWRRVECNRTVVRLVAAR
jgi:hypothetical protein